MRYQSNLIAPDLRPHFKHLHERVMGHSFGHDEISDWADRPADDPVLGLYKNCGFWSHDEAAILYTIAKRGGFWLDIGAHTGWTAAHMAEAGCHVTALEPMLPLPEWRERFRMNTQAWAARIGPVRMRADEYFAAIAPAPMYDGIVIDGDHIHPNPLADALGSSNHLKRDGVILFHDAIGDPVWNGIYALTAQNFRCHIYLTPHIVACCWRGNWKPPVHVPDPAINWKEIQTNHMKGFAWDRVTCDAY